MTIKPAVRQAWPSGKQALRFKEGEQVVEIIINWDYAHSIARRALRNKGGLSSQGPVSAKVVRS